jgi:hypothetical protein
MRALIRDLYIHPSQSLSQGSTWWPNSRCLPPYLLDAFHSLFILANYPPELRHHIIRACINVKMYASALASSLLLLASSTSALSLFPRTDSCPEVWSTVLPELQTAFDGCGRDAHGAIRAPFHDCINNGCDGSLILTDECSRAENAGLSNICGKLLSWTQKYNTSAADMIEFAAAVAISSCPLGPRVRALVGRKDSSEAAPLHSMPGSRDSISSILEKFKAKGFNGDDVVALMGTHSVAVQVNDDPAQAGKSLDSTPSIYDLKFYQETLDGTAPYSLQSDKGLANNTEVSGSRRSNARSILTLYRQSKYGRSSQMATPVNGTLPSLMRGTDLRSLVTT